MIDSLSTGATYVTDKMPLNFLYLGSVELLFPDSPIIHLRRDPRDTCLSCYFTDFGKSYAFTGDIAYFGSYYRDYQRLMEHWRWVLKTPILDVRYEDLVADPAGQIKRMLDFLDLPWDERCLNFHENKRSVATASREQVRRPMYQSSVGRWKNYEKHLMPLARFLDGSEFTPAIPANSSRPEPVR